MDGSKAGETEAEIELVATHLANAKVILKVVEFEFGNDNTSLGYTYVREDSRIEMCLNASLFKRELEGLALAKYPLKFYPDLFSSYIPLSNIPIVLVGSSCNSLVRSLSVLRL